MALLNRIITLLLLLFAVNSSLAQTTYYSKAAATDFNSTASWGINTDGSGASPASITNADNYIIQNNAALTLNANGSVRQLTINTGSLTIAANTLTVAIAGANNSTLQVSGGSLNVTGGTLNINGNLFISDGANFSQSGGNINIDGNSGTLATSVAGGTDIFSIGTSTTIYATGTIALSGGTLTIVDPHAATMGQAFYFNSSAGHVNAIGHAFRFGDGVSATPGGNATSAFSHNTAEGTSRFAFGNLTINGPYNANRVVTALATLGVLGDLTINAGGQYNPGSTVYVNGNITVNGDGTSTLANNGRLVTVAGLTLANYQSGIESPSPNAQTISGNGYFVNNATIASSTANFNNLSINNSSAAGVTFANANTLRSVIPGLYTNTASVLVTFALTAGKLNIGSNTFTLGTSVTSVGGLSYTTGGFTGGTFRRWVGTAAITPATGGAIATGAFPFISANGESRLLQYGQTATITTGGTVSVTYNDVVGQTDITPYLDNGISIGKRSNSNWVVATSGLVYGTGRGILKIRGDGYTVANVTDARISGVSGTAAGTSGLGTNTLAAPEGNKSAMTVANLAGTFYFATPSYNFVHSVATGNWTNPTTWDCNCVPSASSDVQINNTHTVTIDAAANARTLTLNAGGLMQSAANTLTVTNWINNSGIVNISGSGTVTLGTTDNDNPFNNLSGSSLNVSGGTLNINGNLFISDGANFSQSGGNINIDGNSGTVATSVAAGTDIFSIGTLTTIYATGTIALSGGTLTIVDPHAATTGQAFYFNSSAGHVDAIGHTFRFGDGVSATPGGNATSAFQHNTVAGTFVFAFGNLTINGPYNANRVVTAALDLVVLGDLTINAGGQYKPGNDINVNGNITVNGDGTSTLANNGMLVTTNWLILSNFALGSFSPSTNAQTISGNGYFVNNATIASSTANFNNLSINNSSAAGVTFANANTLTSVISGLYINTATISNLFRLSAGKINIGSNTFTLGTSTANLGLLQYTLGAGGFTGGTFKRWVGFSNITPNTGGVNNIGAFPFVSANGESRLLQYGQTATVTTGGSVSVTYNDVAGQTAITPYTDNGVTIAKRSNSNWVVATSGLVYGTGGTGRLKIRGDGYLTPDVTGARISRVNGAAAGTSGVGTNTVTAPEGNKSAMTVANLAGTFYFALPTTTIQTVATGNWTNPATWNCNCVPGGGDSVIVNNTHTVTIDATANAGALVINTGGTIQAAANTLTVVNRINNSGTVNISGTGTITLGTTDNNNPFNNLSGGSLNVTGGTLNINGNLFISDGANFSQSGGNINIDGNSGTLATSVAAGTDIFSIGTSATIYATGTIALSGGILTIVDPHAATTGQAFYFNSSAGHVNAIGHTFRYGDGVSATPGGNATTAFENESAVSASRLAFGNLIINGPYNANRVVTTLTAIGVLGDLTINAGGQLNTGGGILILVNGNITVNGDGTSTPANNGRLITTGTLYLANYASGVITSSTNAQTISGNGYFVNNATIASSTANFGNLTINNTSTAGVTFANANTVRSVIPVLYTNTATVPGTGTFALTAGKLNIGANTFILGTATNSTGALSYTAGGFTGGTFRRWVGTAAITPTTGGAIATGAFPFISANGESRMLQYGQTATVTTGGTVSVTYNDVAGQTAITPYTDNGISIGKRSNSNWVVATSGLVYGTGRGILKIRGDGYTVANVTDARISSATGIAAGTSGVGTNTIAGPEGNKSAMTVANLAGTFYFALPATTIQTVATGNWTNPSTWNCNCVPTGLDSVIVNNTHTVTIDATANALALVVNTGGTIQAAANTLTVVNRINNSGSVNISGTGTITLGTTDNNNPFTNLSGGSLNVTGGTLSINGNLLISDGANFNQSGGNINIDGNSGTVATSVAAGTNIFAVGTSLTPHATGTIALSGGTLTIIDPHAATTGIAFYFNSSAGHVYAIGHTFRFGDGVSATPGGNATTAFQHFTGAGTSKFSFGNLTINGPYNVNRVVTALFFHGVVGDLTINAGGQYNHSYIGSGIWVNGNITVNGDGTSTLANNGRLITTGSLSLAYYQYQTEFLISSTNAQTISGNGYFVNNTTIASSTANFGNLTISNTSAAGVTFANANSLTSVVPGLYTNTATVQGNGNFNLGDGKINIGANTFTLGTSAAQAGTLNYGAGTGGFTGGTFRRWVGTAAITPATGGAIAAGAFPFVSANGESRLLQYGQTATVTTGGTVSVTYNDVAGQTAITPYTDNGISIGKRSNANWVVATAGLVYGTGRGILKIRGDGYAVTNVTDARISGATGIAAGTSGVGTNTLAAPEGNKSAMTVANLAGTFYFALPTTTIQTVATGNWSSPSTWNCLCVPTSLDSVIINNTHTVTIDATANALGMVINSGGTIQAAANTLTVVNRINNSGTVNISGTGTITLGTTDNNNPFTNLTGGSLNVSGGTLNINGNLLVSDGSNFNQSGGNINIDGNSGTVATSVPAGTNLFAVGTSTTVHASGTIALSGGTLTIIDPHAATTGIAFYFRSSAGFVNSIGHTFRFGDGVSSTPGGNATTAFQCHTWVSAGKFAWGNLTINGPYNANRVVTAASDFGVLGDLTINAGGQLFNNNIQYVNGNITVNGDGTSTLANNGRLITNFIYLANFSSGLFPSTNAQTISGNGYFVNNTTIASSTANFQYLIINNTSTAGVTFANANTLTSVIPGLYTNTATVGAGEFTLIAGKLNIGANTFTLGTSAASPGTLVYTAGGFTSGTFRRWVGTAAITPTTGGAIAAGSFPFVSANGESRMLQYGQTATVTTGGTVSVTYNDVAGQTAITPYTDNGISIGKRSNSNWVVATSGLVYGTGRGILKIRGDGYPVANVTDARISSATGIAAGTSGAGTNTLAAPEGNKSAMTVANLAGTFYFALPTTTIQTVATGNWTNPATWNCNCVPSGLDSVIVNNTHTVTINATANALAMVINTGGTIQAAANTLTVFNRINNSGTVNISGTGTITLGTTDNDNPFTNQTGGSLNVSGGTLNINGNLLVSNGSNFNQSGGNINIDGNSGTVATSVAAGTDIFSIGTNTTPYNSGNTQFTGGTLTIIDPHAGTTGMAFFYYSTVGSVNATGHTLRFGDGISVTSGGNNQSFDHYSGFNTNTTLFSFGNLIINGPYNNFRRCGGSSDIILGDLIINQGGQYNPGFLFANGNITVNGDGSSVIANNGALIIPGFLLLQNGPSSPSNNAQTISGNGYFVNNATIASSTANFGNLTINNTSTAGVTFANANTLTSVISGLYTNTATVPGTGTFTLTAGKLNIGSNTFTLGTSAAALGTLFYNQFNNGGFTSGTFKRWVGTAAITPTTGGAIAAGAFPFISADGESRLLQYGQTTTVTSGGTVSVTYNDVAGQTAITPYTDNGISIANRSNSNWVVATGNGLAYGTGTGILKIRGDGYAITNVSDARISGVSGAAAGTSGVGTNTLAAPEGNKSAMTVANLSGTFYFATPSCAPPVPVANTTTPGCSSFTASWSNVGATGYLLFVATDALFTNLVTGYDSLYVGGGATSYNVNTNLLPGQTYYYRVKGFNSSTCISNASNFISVTIPSTTVAPTFTAGATTICANGTDTYTATATVGTVTYSIVGGTDASINATTGVLTSAGTANFTVRATSTGTCGGPFSTDRAVTVNPLPNQPGAFTTSSSSLCAATTSITYALTNDPTVTYNWSYSGLNATINGTGNSVTVDFANNATSGTLSVTATNGCGTSTARTIAITINPIPDLQITVPAAVCAPGTVNITTGVVVDANGTTGTLSYFPTLTDATNGTNALSNPSAIAVSGIYYIKKTATVGGCIDINAVAVTVNSLPGAAGNITGTAAVCQGQTGVIYTVPAITNATGYTWILPSGATITAGFNTNSITVSYSNSATSGNITVRGTNSCGNGTISANFAVTVDALPATVVATAGTGATYYSINANWGAVANNISYILEVSDVSDFSSSGVFYAYVGNVTSYTVLQLNPNTTYYYRIYATNLCGVASVSNTIAYTTLPIVTGPLTWNGSVSTDWNDANNWTPNTIPTTLDDVIVPNVTNDPALTTGANGNIKDINISSGATVTIGAGKTLDVKGNWSGTTTTIVSGAGKTIFSGTSGAQTITGGGTFSTLQINNSNGVTAASGGNFVNVTTALELKAGTLTTNGNLKTISTSTGTAYINDFSSGFTGSLSGLVSVERFIPPSPNGFRYIGQPVNTGAGVMAISAMQGFTVTGVPGQTIPLPTCSPSNLAPNSPYGNLMYFQENGPYGSPACRQRGWWYQTTGNLTVGRGYGIKQGGNTKITYRGTANTGTITSSATSTHTAVFTPAGNNGWNLVSNPYPSAITIDEMGGNPNPLNDMPAGFDKQIQFYITGNSNLTGSYQTYNVAINGAADIALGQGFWVRVTTPGTTPAWTLGQGHRTTASPTYFDVNPQIESHLKVNVSGNGFADLSNIYFVNGAESGLDIYDGNKWSSATGQPTLYTKAGEEVMGINSLPSLSETMVVPMGLTPGANGNFTFNFEDIASFPQTAMIYLEDLKLGTMNNLRDNATYEFAANLNDNPDRFMLHFQPGLQAEVADQDCDSQGSIELTQPAPTVWSTYEVKGNDNNVYATGSNLTGTLTVSNLPAQEYVVTVTHPSGYSAQEYITLNGSSPINATINASATNVQVDEMVSLTANTTNASEYVWNFGDGNTQTGSANVVHAYDAEGTYNVTLTATNDVCNDIAVKTINVANTTTAINNASAKNLNAYGSGNRIVVEFNNWGEGKANLTVYNMLGQQLNSITDMSTAKGRQELQLTGIKPGYYLLKVTTQDELLYKKLYLSE